MNENLAKLYTALFNKLESLKIPFSFKTPHIALVGRGTVLNDMSDVFPQLNEVLVALDLESIDIKPMLKQLRDGSLNGIDLSIVTIEAHDLFERKRGEALRVLEGKMRELGGFLPQSSRLETKEEPKRKKKLTVLNTLKKSGKDTLKKIKRKK